MRDLPTIANLAEIFGAIVVVAGVVFAVIQIRLFRRQRLEAAAIEVIRSWLSPEFTRAFSMIQQGKHLSHHFKDQGCIVKGEAFDLH